MNKVVKENYEIIMKDLQPLFTKWGVAGVSGAMWRYTRTRSKLQELADKKLEIDKEIKKYEKLS